MERKQRPSPAFQGLNMMYTEVSYRDADHSVLKIEIRKVNRCKKTKEDNVLEQKISKLQKGGTV